MPNIGTIYGGSLQINTDGTGVLTGTKALVTYTGASNESWGYSTHPTSGIGRVYINSPEDALANTNDLLSNMLTASDTIKQYPDAWKICIPSGSAIRIGVPDTITSADDWKTLLASNNLQIIYPLATPVIHNLSASEVGQLLALNGVNNVWSNLNEQITVTGWGH